MILPRDNSVVLVNGAQFYSCERYIEMALTGVRADKAVGYLEIAAPERLVALQRLAMPLFYMEVGPWAQ